MKVSELTGTALDWAVAKCEWIVAGRVFDDMSCWNPSTDWAQGGPIIEREEIGLRMNVPCSPGRTWESRPSPLAKGAGGKFGYGPTPLVAAMRSYVARKLGDEIEVPEELLK